MKICVITCHFVHNYGAVLQAYALKTYLEGNDVKSEVEIIDYRPEYLAKPHKVFHIGSEKYKKNLIIKVLYIARTFPFRFTTYRNFNRFVKSNLNTSKDRYKTYFEIEKNPPYADAYICGSDQIWNTSVSNGKDPSYYLLFAKNQKKVAYAPSFAIETISEADVQLIKPWISKIDKLSTREVQGQKILNNMGFENAPVVLDPVFLLSQGEWNKLIGSSSYEEKPYVLIYKITNNTSLYNYAKEVAKILNAKVIEIGFSAKCGGKIDKYICGPSPEKFLSYLKNAAYIVTDSFHGVSFSLIYHKKFTVFNRGDVNSRLESLLQKVGLMDRFYDSGVSVIEYINREINYSNVDFVLSSEISYSKDYLRRSILND